MRILVFGAGVLGTLYGARLTLAGHDVTLLARGARLEQLRARGAVLQDALSGVRTAVPVNATDTLATDDAYELIIVLVRKTQLETVLPVLAHDRATPSILFMVNTAEGAKPYLDAVGPGRVLMGFAGTGGTLDEEGVVSYTVTPGLLQRTTLGEPDGSRTRRLLLIADAFREAGFSVAIERNMDAWLKTHVAWVSPVANAIYAAAGDVRRLSRTPDAMRLMLRAVKENFSVLTALGIPITPPKLRLLTLIPEALAIRMLPPVIGSRWMDVIAARHANAARDEMARLAEEFAQLVTRAGVNAPYSEALRRYVDETAEPLPQGSADLTAV